MRSIRKAAFGTALACVLACGTAQAGDFGFGGFWSWFGNLFGDRTEQGIGTPIWVILKADTEGTGTKADTEGTGAKADTEGTGKN